MGKHRGKILESAIRSMGIKISHVASRMKISRRTIYNYFEDEKLSDDKMERFDLTFNLNLGNYYTKTRNYNNDRPSQEVNETDAANVWKSKYFDLLERYTRLLEDNTKK
jgi:AcrR family transcriptional regulator